MAVVLVVVAAAAVAVAVAVAVVERLNDDKVDFENIDDDGYYYCQQLMVVALLVDLVWINYPADKSRGKNGKMSLS